MLLRSMFLKIRVSISSEQKLAAFETVRFDLEELAEELIEDEAFNQMGQMKLLSSKHNIFNIV